MIFKQDTMEKLVQDRKLEIWIAETMTRLNLPTTKIYTRRHLQTYGDQLPQNHKATLSLNLHQIVDLLYVGKVLWNALNTLFTTS